MKRAIISGLLLTCLCLFYTNAAGGSKPKAPKKNPVAAAATIKSNPVAVAATALPTSIDYTLEFVTVVRNVYDVNRHREMAGQPMVLGPLNSGAYVDQQGVVTNFDCPMFERADERYTHPTAINNNGTVVGNCASGLFGFLRHRSGELLQYSIPGAQTITSSDINDLNQVVGEMWGPLIPGHSGWYRVKAFLRDPNGNHAVISAPSHSDDVGFPNSLTRTLLLGINNKGWMIGTRTTIFTPSNAQGQWSAFLYSNGVFTTLPAGHIPVDINNDEQILLSVEAGGFAVYDDGHMFKVNNPAGYVWSQINAINDMGQLTGVVRENFIRTQPSDPFPKSFQVLATPVTPAAVAKR
jgi:hypothetical protein